MCFGEMHRMRVGESNISAFWRKIQIIRCARNRMAIRNRRESLDRKTVWTFLISGWGCDRIVHRFRGRTIYTSEENNWLVFDEGAQGCEHRDISIG